jgi:hypothetical protein
VYPEIGLCTFTVSLLDDNVIAGLVTQTFEALFHEANFELIFEIVVAFEPQ